MANEERTVLKTEANRADALILGIPAGRDIGWTVRILSLLAKPSSNVEVLVSRWVENLLTDQNLQLLNDYFPTQEVRSEGRHAPAMRNAIVRTANSSHLLFLDDDMVPEADLLTQSLALVQREPDVVHQGLPYLVANPHSWLARTEGRLYEKTFNRYLIGNNEPGFLDARLMLAPVKLLQETPFNESMVFGGGEGHELSKSLRELGVSLRVAPELHAAHINRETIMALVAQKRAHGRGRGYMLAKDGPGKEGWMEYAKGYFNRHVVGPAKDWQRGDLDAKELMYVWGTYAALWLGVVEEIVRSKYKAET